MNRVTWEWLAGFTDGDGCISIPRVVFEGRGRPSQIKVSWYQSTKAESVLDAIAEFLDKKQISVRWYLHNQNQDVWTLCVQGAEQVEKTLRGLLPFLVLKYEIADEALALLEILPRGRYYEKKSHCKHGHDLRVTKNVYVRANGHRQCRVCARRLDKIRRKVG